MPCLTCGCPTRGHSYCPRHYPPKATRQARGLGAGWPTLSAQVLARDEYVCWICGLGNANTVDHVVRRRDGGTNDPDNLRAAHRSCNSKRG
jgi:5-methylcytosine-specific restriction endonuclease McrA